MAKKSTIDYVCQSCGAVYPKWQGKCDACGEWNTIVEEKRASEEFSNISTKKPGNQIDFVSLNGESQTYKRLVTNLSEINRVSGGGLVPGSVILVGGDPGIGKSTLLLQICAGMANKLQDNSCFYISGEEAIDQVRIRAKRLGLADAPVRLASTTSVKDIIATLEKENPTLVIIDSIQTMYIDEVESTPGSVAQVRAAAYELIKIAKKKGFTLFLVGHVTKQGSIAGPRVLEHMVDTVLYFEGDRYASYRILRGVKNRFGSTNEIGVFEMQQSGLSEVENPSEYMLNGRPENASGSVVVCLLEGTRPIMVEIQALVCDSNFGMARRTAAGTDYNRVNLLMAVLEKRAGIHMSGSDAYVNVAGGIKVSEPALDLGIVMALVSSFKNRAIDEKTVIFGEVGLAGEVRAVSQAQQRVNEAVKLGFKTCILPGVCLKNIKKNDKIEIIGVNNVQEAIKLI